MASSRILTCSDSSDSGSISESSSNEEVQEIHSYNDSVEPVPTEQEAIKYIEQLELEEEEELTLLSRFSGEEDVSDWYVDVLFPVFHTGELFYICFRRIIHNNTILRRALLSLSFEYYTYSFTVVQLG